MVAAYTQRQQRQLQRAADAAHGCSRELGMAAVSCALEEWEPAYRYATEALELWLVASLIVDTEWQDQFGDFRKPMDGLYFEETIVVPLSDVEFCARTGEPADPRDEATKRTPEQWDSFILGQARLIEALGDNFEREAAC